MNELKIISKLCDLLDSGEPEDFASAARMMQGNSFLAELLEHLSIQSSYVNRGKREHSYRKIRKKSIISSKEASPRKPADVLKSKDAFSSTDELAVFLNSLPLELNFRPRDGRKKMVDKLVRRLEQLPDADRRRLTALISRRLPDTVTAGWFNAIRRSQGE